MDNIPPHFGSIAHGVLSKTRVGYYPKQGHIFSESTRAHKSRIVGILFKNADLLDVLCRMIWTMRRNYCNHFWQFIGFKTGVLGQAWEISDSIGLAGGLGETELSEELLGEQC